MSVDLIIKKIGYSALSASLGVTRNAVVNAKVGDAFPSSWYGVLSAECDRRGIECPMELFSFKQPKSGQDAA